MPTLRLPSLGRPVLWLVGGLIVTMVLASRASAASSPNFSDFPYVFENAFTQQCLSDHSGSVTEDPCTNATYVEDTNPHAQWEIAYPVRAGSAMLRNNGTHHCLSGTWVKVLHGRAVGYRLATAVCNDRDPHQLWSQWGFVDTTPIGPGIHIRNGNYRNPDCIDAISGTPPVTMMPCLHGDQHQSWETNELPALP